MTKTEVALQTLRDAIRSGTLKPGQRLRVTELTQMLGMSPTPIREALRLLQADRLVDYRPHHGSIVAHLSAVEIAEIFRLRILLEPLATELAVPNLTSRQVTELDRLHQRLRAATTAKRGGSFSERNAAWHWAIYKAAGSSYLYDFIQRLWEAFPWRTMWVLPGRVELAISEHEKILEAIYDRDATRASEQMRLHIQGSKAGMPSEERSLDGDHPDVSVSTTFESSA